MTENIDEFIAELRSYLRSTCACPLDKASNIIEEQKREIARLREALKPFAAVAESIKNTDYFHNNDPRQPTLDTPVSYLVQKLGDPITIGAVFSAYAAIAWEDEREWEDERDAEIDRLREALDCIFRWAKAYPLEVFPEPDFARARNVLSSAGISLEAISASNMRHVVSGVADIARAALSGYDK